MTRWTLLLLVLAAACGTAPSTDPSPSTTGDRITAIEVARDAVRDPAVALGSASLTITERLGDVESASEDDAVAARASLADAADALSEAAADADAVELDTDVADVASAAAALEVAANAGQESAATARGIVEALARAEEVDAQLGDLVDQWAEPGSRRQQLDRFAEIADRAEELASALEEETDGMTCSHVLDVRVAAARAVAAGSLELRELVAGYRGNEYDQRLPELTADPYGLGATPYVAVLDDGICPALDIVRQEAADALSALDDLQRALDPPDL